MRFLAMTLLLLIGIVGSLLLLVRTTPLSSYQGEKFVAIEADIRDLDTGEPLPEATLEIRARHGSVVHETAVTDGRGMIGILLPAHGTQSLLNRETQIDTMGFSVAAHAEQYEEAVISLTDDPIIEFSETFPYTQPLVFKHTFTLKKRPEPEPQPEPTQSTDPAPSDEPTPTTETPETPEEESETPESDEDIDAPPPSLDQLEGLGLPGQS